MNEEQRKQFARIVAKAWTDDAFRSRLEADVVQALKDEGIKIPDGTNIRLVQDTDDVTYLVLPKKPTNLSIEELEATASNMPICGGFWICEV